MVVRIFLTWIGRECTGVNVLLSPSSVGCVEVGDDSEWGLRCLSLLRFTCPC